MDNLHVQLQLAGKKNSLVICSWNLMVLQLLVLFTLSAALVTLALDCLPLSSVHHCHPTGDSVQLCRPSLNPDATEVEGLWCYLLKGQPQLKKKHKKTHKNKTKKTLQESSSL